ncbi:MAG: T9SS type A sorting domain-containing protein [Ignavibacteriales bacterium]|nr:T9SS type A sorting domain-containing protein [Ignavibacteriales bacterium]
MKIKIKKDFFDPKTQLVYVVGNFNNWKMTTIMQDPDGDSIYTFKLFDQNKGSELKFKFAIRDCYLENSPERKLILINERTVYEDFFDGDSVYSAPLLIDFIFSVNMVYEIVLNRLNPKKDTVIVRSNFGKCFSNIDRMQANPTSPNFYEQVKQRVIFGVDEKVWYKFGFVSGKDTIWENEIHYYSIGQDDINYRASFCERTFNDLNLEVVLNRDCTIKFHVDVKTAISDSSLGGEPFDSIKNVVIAGTPPPLKWPQENWPDSDSNKVIFLYDDRTNGDEIANDNIWSKEIILPMYSLLRVEYRFGINFGLQGLNKGSNNNESLNQTHFFDLYPWETNVYAMDFFGKMGENRIIFDNIEEPCTAIISDNFQLSQNYPNPFNPTTKIRYTLPSSGYVTLKVFDVLGKEVATLVKEEKPAGEYIAEFNASVLSSGIYFYQLKAGSFIQTKKMIVLR